MRDSYNDKSIDQIKADVKKDFEKNDSFWIRDDQEIYNAWLNVINKYRNEVLNSNRLVRKERYIVWKDWKPVIFRTWNEYRKAAKRFFDKAYNKIVNLHNTVTWLIKFTSDAEDKKLIANVAVEINKAEDAALKEIADYCNPMQEWSNASYHSSVVRDKQWKPKVKEWKIETQKPLFTQSKDWTITFTDRANPLKIHQAMGNLFKNKDKVYKIDYSKCTDPGVKNKMQSLIWWSSCWIKYDSNLKTYVLTDKTWKVISNRALVREGVTIKQDTIIESQARDNKWPWMTKEERSSLDNLRSTSEAFAFDANNYRYYEQLRQSTGKNICAAYAYWVVSDILAKKWCCFPAQEVDAWKISWQSSSANHFNIDKLDDNNPQQQIVNAPAGTFLTMRFDRSSATKTWVSHVMVSLWNGVYTDLFGAHIRTIDFKSSTKFSWKKFTYWWWSYTLTDDSRLISPKLWSFPTWSKQTINWEDLTPNEFAAQVQKSTGANMNYIKSLIASQNNIPESKFWNKVESLSIRIISKTSSNLELENKEWSNNVANDFLDSLKDNKAAIMRNYPRLTDHEYDEIAKRAMWILYQESNAWDHWTYSTKESWAGALLIPILKWWEERSRWYTQIKFNQIFSQEDNQYLRSFGINSGSDLTDARKCWIATMVWLIRKYYDYIVPMKSEPFWRNDAEIIELTFNNKEYGVRNPRGKNITESIARGKPLRELGWRPRTEAEIQAKIKEWSDKNWWIAKQEIIIRKWITNDNEFFDFLYYARNQPSQIKYWTATPSRNTYIAQSRWFINQHTTGGTSVA